MPAMTTEQLFASSGGGAKLFFNRDSVQGASITGTIVESQPVQARDYEDNKLRFWDDGSEVMQLSITLQTNLRENGDDDGKRRVFVSWWGSQKNNLLDAVHKAGAKFIADGGVLTVTFAGFGEQKDRKLNAPKLYEFKYVLPPSATEALMTKDNVAVVTTTSGGDIVAQARKLQQEQAAALAAQQAAATPPPPPAGQPSVAGSDPNAIVAAMTNVKKLATAGFDAGTIKGMVPELTMEQITAILTLP